MSAYRTFLEGKAPIAQCAGLPCDLDEVPTHLLDGREIKPHQRAIVRWAVEGGRRALFEAFGLGKTLQQILVCDIILRKLEATEGFMPDGLIVCPLGVRREFIADAAKLGIELRFVRSDADIDAGSDKGGRLDMVVGSLDEKRDPVKITVFEEFFNGTEQGLEWKERRQSDEFTFGWAITCHKSQGSQWDNVIIFDESGAFRDARQNWIYTAVTRAAERVTVVI